MTIIITVDNYDKKWFVALPVIHMLIELHGEVEEPAINWLLLWCIEATTSLMIVEKESNAYYE